jgi:hypothetical protein
MMRAIRESGSLEDTEALEKALSEYTELFAKENS